MSLIYILLILLLLFNNNNKNIGYIAIIYILILFAFNTDVADRENYELTLKSIENVSIEPAYGALYSFLMVNGLDIQWAYYICAPLLLISFYCFVHKYSGLPNYVIAIYMICMFFLDVVQNRFSYASIFLYLAFYFLLGSDKKKATIRFLVLILIASMFHVSSLFFLLFLTIRYLNNKHLNIFILVLGVSLLSLTTFMSTFIGNVFGITAYMTRLLTSDNYSGSNMVVICIILELLTFIMYYVSCKFMPKNIANYSIIKDNGWKIAKLSLLYIPLFIVSADFRRLYFVTFIILVTITSNWVINCKYKVAMLFQLMIALLLFYYFSFAGYSYETVIKAIFNNNVLLSNI